MPAPKHIGTHLYLRRESAGVSSATVKPAFTAADEVGIVSDVQISPDYGNETVIDAPSPGAMDDIHVIQPRRRLIYTMTIREVSQLFWELLFQTGPLTPSGGSATFSPGAGLATNAWSHIEQYDHNDLLVMQLDMWTHVRVEPVSFGAQEVTFSLHGRKLRSTLNVGELQYLV